LFEVAAVVVLLAATPPVYAQTEPGTSDGDASEPGWTVREGSTVTLFPASDVFPVYVADPHRPMNTISTRLTTQSGIPGTTHRRTGLSAGGRFGMIRFDTPGRRSWQVSIDAGIDALFDSHYSDEAIGWDGNYGLTVTTAGTGPWSLKIAVLHTSAHVGDEYEDRMKRSRINYTREELAVGVSWRPAARWRAYGEAGHAYSMLNAEQAPWRLQTGMEVETSPRLLGSRFAWYGAMDVQAAQERNWRVDTAVEGGVVARAGSKACRLLVQHSRGRPTVAEFFASSESTITLAVRIDL
jgi:hypothetical protein